MFDRTFELRYTKPITYSRKKFSFLNVHPTPEVAIIIRDVIMNHDPLDPYKTASVELIKRRDESSHQEIRKLLIEEELRD
ncbi:hypothetical protein TNCT_568211 [Trichonephila clavata]|uniref:DUF7041 domain-containing protein n=1 Tax=Trichonephila clavata TaxID=2740835 RepID=A0A8X6HBV4_TRICU|nr:hypothetical protein TNCT_568211 [Trichonephila clavata]